MFIVYYVISNQEPVKWAEYDVEAFAQIIVDAGNILYAGEREFYFEDTLADESIEEVDEDFEEDENYREDLAPDFEREEARAYNASINTIRI